jgi:hypothetical protein
MQASHAQSADVLAWNLQGAEPVAAASKASAEPDARLAVLQMVSALHTHLS